MKNVSGLLQITEKEFTKEKKKLKELNKNAIPKYMET